MTLKKFINFFKKKKEEIQTYDQTYEETTIHSYELDQTYLRERYNIKPINPYKVFGDHVRDDNGNIVATLNQSGLAMTPDGRIIGYYLRGYDFHQDSFFNPKINDRKQFKLKRK
jgi:hypothetical protein